MTNPEITNNDVSQLEVFAPEYQQDVVAFGTAETRPVGQILARKLVSDTVTVTPDLTTGNGTCTNEALSANGATAKVGTYNLECVEKIATGGRFKLEDPDGKLLSDQLVIPLAATLYFEGFGLRFDLVAGGTDYEIADRFDVDTTSDGALDSYDPAGIDGTQDPTGLMTRARTEAVAADYPESVLIKGEVRRATVETAQGAVVSKELKDRLSAIGIILRDQIQLAELDNQ